MNCPRDWDICIPLAKWPEVARFTIPAGTPANNFGGFKITTKDGLTIDVWGMEVADYFLIVDNPQKNAIAVNVDKHLTIRATNTEYTHEGQTFDRRTITPQRQPTSLTAPG